MAKIESCITHPKEEDFFIVRRAYYELCGSDKVKAALLWVLEWFTTERMRNMCRRKETGDPWIEFSIEEMRNEMFGYLSHRRMPEALEELQNCGWVKIRKSGVLGGKSQYLLLIDVVQKRVNDWALTAEEYAGSTSDKYIRPVGQMSDDSVRQMSDETENSVGQMADVRRTNVRIYKEDVELEEKTLNTEEPGYAEKLSSLFQDQKQPLSFPSGLENSKPRPTPPQSPSPLPEDLEVKVFKSSNGDMQPMDIGLLVRAIQNRYGKCRNGAEPDATGRFIKGNLKSKANTGNHNKIDAAQQQYGADRLLSELDLYLAEDDDSLREKKWPLMLFISDLPDRIQKQPKKPRRSAATQSEQHPGYQSDPSHIVNAPSAITGRVETNGFDEKQKSQPVHLQYVDKWNTIVPDKAIGVLPAFVAGYVEKAVKAGCTEEVFEQICRKCAKIVEHGQMPDLGFTWLWTQTQAGRNWEQLWLGKWNWAEVPKRAAAPISAIDQAMADAERQERENGKA